MFREYIIRNETLLRLGFSSYDEYLQSDLWRRIRKKAMRANDRQCVLCGATATEVHHTDYSEETLLGKNPDALLPLCNTCHAIAEFDTEGDKRSLNQANSTLGLLKTHQERPAKKTSRRPQNSPICIKCGKAKSRRKNGGHGSFCASCWKTHKKARNEKRRMKREQRNQDVLEMARKAQAKYMETHYGPDETSPHGSH